VKVNSNGCLKTIPLGIKSLKTLKTKSASQLQKGMCKVKV
jgi:hypothetical protein